MIKLQDLEFDLPKLVLVEGDHTGTRHRLEGDWHIKYKGEYYTVVDGFITDGASIPYWLRPICGSPYKSPRLIAALLHDWLYDGGDPQVDRAEADAIYRDVQIALGISSWKAWIEWTALRVGGASHWNGRADI